MHTLPDFPNLFVLDHPLIQHKVSLMRDESRSIMGFRQLLEEVSLLMGYEVTRDMPLTTERMETPLARMDAPVLAGKKLCIVPILRAGLGMASGLHSLVPSAREGHIGLFRDPVTKLPVEYLVKLPDPEGRMFIVVDPMLATGNTAVCAADLLNRHGVEDAQIRFMAVVAAPEGVRNFHERHPRIPIYIAALDSHLDADSYIVPGLGDAGDRMFGTR
ncbi:MAG: uracil phosphoribosyltransferase [Rhodospirillaceae bacterium]